MNNPDIYCSMHYDVPVAMENTIRWYHNNIGSDKRVDFTFENEGKIVAFGGLTNINRDNDKAELYVFVNPYMHKSGYGTMATRALCEYGFEKLGLNKIYLETNEDNLVARHVYEKCGFILEGVHREEYKTVNGHLMSRLYYGLLKREFNG